MDLSWIKLTSPIGKESHERLSCSSIYEYHIPYKDKFVSSVRTILCQTFRVRVPFIILHMFYTRKRRRKSVTYCLLYTLFILKFNTSWFIYNFLYAIGLFYIYTVKANNIQRILITLYCTLNKHTVFPKMLIHFCWSVVTLFCFEYWPHKTSGPSYRWPLQPKSNRKQPDRCKHWHRRRAADVTNVDGLPLWEIEGT